MWNNARAGGGRAERRRYILKGIFVTVGMQGEKGNMVG